MITAKKCKLYTITPMQEKLLKYNVGIAPSFPMERNGHSLLQW